MSRLLIFSFLLLAWTFSAWGAETLVVPGSGDSQELLRALAKAFEAENPGIRVEVPESVGTSGGIRAVVRGEAVLARIARPLRKREEVPGLKSRFFAESPIVFAANLKGNCPETIPSSTLLDIYRGTLQNWKEICPGSDHKIYIATREEGDSSRTVLEERFPGFADLPQTHGKVLYSTPETVEVLMRYPHTLAYIPYPMVKNQPLLIFHPDGKKPDPEAVQLGRYPWTTPFGVAWKDPLPHAYGRFVEFLFSEKAHRIIRDQGALPINLQISE